jgi:histidinol-phosphatase (PHP family)
MVSADMHTHTDNSYDGNHSAMFLCQTACEKGLRAIAFTDHVEMDRYFAGRFDRAAKQSYVETIKARSAFQGRLLVCTGVELGQATYDRPQSEKLLRSFAYDVVVGSIHNLRDRHDFWFMNFNDCTDADIAQLLRGYFSELRELVEWGNIDVLAHLTYPLRYIVGENGRQVDMSDYAGEIDAILQGIIEKGIALEINTSGLRQSLGTLLPDEPILRRYRELGGSRITLGSDAHFAAHLGAGFAESAATALRCGFTESLIFSGREPTGIPLTGGSV